MLYKLVAVIERTVVDTYNLEIEADDPEEAQDVAYEVMSTHPDADIVVNRLLRVHTEPERPVSIAIEFQRDELSNEGDLVEEVFNDDGDEPA